MTLKNIKWALFIGLLTCNIQYGFSQVDNYQKNKKISEEEDARYKNDLEANPNSAEPHWQHANRMAEFTFNAYKSAWNYYNKALEIDSTNADIYKDYGDYLADKLGAIEEAKVIYEKGLRYSPDRKDIKEKIEEVNSAITKRDEDIQLRSFGTTDKKQISHNHSYSNLTNFDSLKTIVSNRKGKYHYDTNLDKFLTDQSLDNYEIYLLLIGYAQTKDYNPYNYMDMDNLHLLADAGQYDEAIKKGQELIKVNPLNPTIYQELMYCHRKKGDNETAVKYQNRIQSIFNAMLYTGDGTCEKPYLTFWVKEEYNFARYVGLSPTGQCSTGMCAGGMADKLEVYNPATKEKEIIHFNIMPIFKKTL